SERDRPAGHFGGPRWNGVGAREPESRHRRDRRDGFPSLPRSADALSRPGDRNLHRLDTPHRPPRTVSGGHPQAPSVVVPECADALIRGRRTNETGGHVAARFISRSPLLFLVRPFARLWWRPLRRRARRRLHALLLRWRPRQRLHTLLRRRWPRRRLHLTLLLLRRRSRWRLRWWLHLALLRWRGPRRWGHLRRRWAHNVPVLRRGAPGRGARASAPAAFPALRRGWSCGALRRGRSAP